MSFSSVKIEGTKAAPDRIYYNGTVLNNTLLSTQTKPDPAVRFQDQRQTPLVPDSSNYEVSVQNFSLNGCSKTLPLFIPQISPSLVVNVVDTIQVKNVEPPQGDVPRTDPTANQTITYTCIDPVTLTPGCVVNNVVWTAFGLPPGPYYFNTPRTVIASTSTSFTLACSYLPANPIPITLPTTVAKYYDPSDITSTIYTVSVGVGVVGVNASQLATFPVIWEPENIASYVPVPVTANPVQVETAYYYCYSYTHWVSLVNKALRRAWAAAVGSYGTACPWLEFDESTGLFSINQDANTCMVPYGTALPPPYDVTSTSTARSGTYSEGEYTFVGMNTCLELLLTNFNSIYFGPSSIWEGPSGLVLPENVINMGLPVDLLTNTIPLSATNTLTATTPVGVSLRTQPKTSIFTLINPFTGGPITDSQFARLPQDFISTGGCWSPIASFVLVTSQIPVRNEASANPISFGQANVGGENANGGAFQKVLLETPIDALTADIWKGWILYEPKTLTFSSLDPSHDGVSDIDVNLFWRNRLTNSLIPVRVPNQSSMSFRLLFKKKLVL